jgi:ribosomal protein S18 acetylase RimI-like enzyme
MKLSHRLQVFKIAKQYFKDWYFIPFVALFSKTVIHTNSDHVAGFVMHSFGKLHYIGISNTHRSKGLGKVLIGKILKDVHRLRVLTDNHIAIGFFEKHGFKKVKTVKTLYGEMFLMKKPLPVAD